MRLDRRPEAAPGRPRWPRRTVRLRLTVLYGALFALSGAALLAITDILSSGGHIYVPVVPKRGGGGASPGLVAQPYDPGGLTPQQHAAEMHHLLTGSAIALGVMAVVSVALGWAIAGRVLRPLRAMTLAARRISEDNLHERLAVPGPGDELKDLGDTIDGLLERLEDAFAAQRRFVANASHELRTPLTLSRTLLQMALSDSAPSIGGFRTTCEEVLEAEGQQERLIEALLTLARSQRGLERREPLDLAVITRNVLIAHGPEAAHRGLEVGTSITTAPVLGDACLLERLVANLVDNALRYNVSRGRLDVQVVASGGNATLRITNTGPAVPANETSRLLLPFQRLPAGQNTGNEGLGLGLSIVAAITKAHRATLSAQPGRHGGLDIEVGFPPGAAITSSSGRALAET